MEWVYDAQERNRWRTFVKAIMNLRVTEFEEFLDLFRPFQLLKKESRWRYWVSEMWGGSLWTKHKFD